MNVQRVITAIGGASELAALCGVSRQVVNNWVARKKIPNGYRLFLLRERPDLAPFLV